MIKFCSACGSIMDNEVCTNKKCSLHKTAVASGAKPSAKKAAKSGTVKTIKVKDDYEKARKNSKCITYSIEELEKLKDNK